MNLWSDLAHHLPALELEQRPDAAHEVAQGAVRLTARIAGASVCLGLEHDDVINCVPRSPPPAVLPSADPGGEPVWYAVVTHASVTVRFFRPRDPLECHVEAMPGLGPLAISWCEDGIPYTMTFVRGDGQEFVYDIAR